MGCCGGRKRRSPVPKARKWNSDQIVEAGEAVLQYTGQKTATITVAGPVTKKQYRFSKFDRVQIVNEPDVQALIKIGIFQRYKG